MKNIRNFSIIAHIDHGKSTLADRMLEITGTIEARLMQDQVLDSMELERERGITIKMQPVRMLWKVQHSNSIEQREGQSYILNLIDTPGHIDFSYEVSRALKAVEGSILLVDATQGVQAQTLTTLGMARDAGLTIIPVISKIDSPLARVEEVKEEIINLLNCKAEEILLVSGKTGEGVKELLDTIVQRIPAPKIDIHNGVQVYSDKDKEETNKFKALVFDFKYSTHRGVIVFVRCFSGKVSKNNQLTFRIANEKFNSIEVGVFSPNEVPVDSLEEGEIGYIVTGIKQPGIASVGDTITFLNDNSKPLEGYESPSPVVWASVYPESQDDFVTLRQSLQKLKLSDSSYTFEEESSGVLGRGFRCGFLGMLHLEIITERLKREFGLELVVTMPTITYKVVYKNPVSTSAGLVKDQIIYSPSEFPDEHLLTDIYEPWVAVTIISPTQYISNIMQLLYDHEAELIDSENFGVTSVGDKDRTKLYIKMPLRELMRNFFDTLKSVTSGFASLFYKIEGWKKADVVRLDILVADEVEPAFTRIVSRRTVELEAEKMVEKLHKIMPRQMFVVKIQGRALGRIISSKTVSAFSKDVTQHMYGGDITRKMKLWEKQKKGKKKMKERGKVNIPQEVFLKMIRN